MTRVLSPTLVAPALGMVCANAGAVNAERRFVQNAIMCQSALPTDDGQIRGCRRLTTTLMQHSPHEKGAP